MNILEFPQKFPTEQSCKEAFIAKRIELGIICKKCGGASHKWKKKREQWECKKCAYRTTVKSGTVMENSKLPFRYWFIAMHLLTCTKKSFSAKEIQRQIEHKRYEPIWAMLHKIRSVMGLRDNRYTLCDEIELDEGFFKTVNIGLDKKERLKRGRGSQKQTQVVVMAESKALTDQSKFKKKYKTKKQLRFVKMKVLNTFVDKEMESIVKGNVDTKTTIVSDNSTSYSKLSDHFDHNPETVGKKDASKILPWIHTLISNAKRLLLDVHHRIDNDFLENYLNEFTYKLNRRYFKDPFDRLLVASVSHRWNDLGESGG